MKQTLTAILVGLGLSALAAPPTVSDVTARQRYPWNGKVDITCTVSGIEGATEPQKFSVADVNPDSGVVFSVSHVKVVREGAESGNLTISSNGVYRLVWDAAADLGEVNRSNVVVRITAIDVCGKVQLWEGGPYWAEMNVGAEAPEEYGLYFWWGDTIGYRREGDAWVASDGSSQNFSFDEGNTPTYYKNIPELRSEGWVVTKDGTDVLAPEHDAAQAHWGGSWRMPTYQELVDLNNMCDWMWTMQNGVAGYVVRGRGNYDSASIFIPAAGWGNMAEPAGAYAGSYGDCWSSDPNSSDSSYAGSLFFDSGDHFASGVQRKYGQPVRPVQGFAE